MALRPSVLLFTRDDCTDCECPLGRSTMRSVVKRCDIREVNLTAIEKGGLGDPDFHYLKYARAHGYRCPLFLVMHPDGRMPEQKIHGRGRSKEFKKGVVERELNEAITRSGSSFSNKAAAPKGRFLIVEKPQVHYSWIHVIFKIYGKNKSSPKDVFAHLLTIAALYVSAINFWYWFSIHRFGVSGSVGGLLLRWRLRRYPLEHGIPHHRLSCLSLDDALPIARICR